MTPVYVFDFRGTLNDGPLGNDRAKELLRRLRAAGARLIIWSGSPSITSEWSRLVDTVSLDKEMDFWRGLAPNSEVVYADDDVLLRTAVSRFVKRNRPDIQLTVLDRLRLAELGVTLGL